MVSARGDGAANVTWRTLPGSAGILPAGARVRGPAVPQRAGRPNFQDMIRPDRGCNPESLPQRRMARTGSAIRIDSRGGNGKA